MTLSTPNYYFRFNGSTDLSSIGSSSGTLTNNSTTYDTKTITQVGSRYFDSFSSNNLAPSGFSVTPFANSHTLVLLFFPVTVSGKSSYGLLANSSSSSSYTKYVEFASSNGAITLHGGTASVTFTPGSWSMDKWHQLVITCRSDGTIDVYLDGSKIGSTTSSTIGSTTMYYIGKGAASHYLHGYIDEIMYNTSEITDAQVLELYNSGKLAYYDSSQWVYPVNDSIALFWSEF